MDEKESAIRKDQTRIVIERIETAANRFARGGTHGRIACMVLDKSAEELRKLFGLPPSEK